MEDGHTLAAYGVRNEITMTLLVRWIVNYRTREVELDMDVTDTVGRIKQRVEEAEGVPVECQSLLLGAEELDALPLHLRDGQFCEDSVREGEERCRDQHDDKGEKERNR
jgi:hypothetical protein